MAKPVSRRSFLVASSGAAAGAAAASAALVLPRHLLAGAPGQKDKAPSERINVAIVGCGIRGKQHFGVPNIVALCDVDESKLSGGPGGAKRYTDYRKMLDEMDKDIDAVLVATPDHQHAVNCMAAIKRGKHVYCEKPLAHSIGEVRALGKAAREHKVVTQLGNQGHSYDSCQILVEWVRDGAIGAVKEVHATCDGRYSMIEELGKMSEKHEVPAGFHWDLWLGPARDRPYHPQWCSPGGWRRWYDFGTSTAGDWVCHTVDPAFQALEFDHPETVVAEVAPGFDLKKHGATFPGGNHTTMVFPAKGKRGPVTLHWYEGTLRIPRPEGLDPDRKPVTVGAILVGEKGGIMYGSHGAAGLRIFPEAQMQAYKRPEKTLPRPREHFRDFAEAIRNGKKAGCDFADYGGPLTEVALLTIIAGRLAGQKLQWDGAAGKFTNSDEANGMLMSHFREGWSL
jgi:predicted dehydrogenase